MVLSIAFHCFRIFSHACCESGSHPNSSSQPPILSITTVAQENSAFVWMAFSRSNPSSTKDCQNCLKMYSLVYFWLFHLLRHLSQFPLSCCRIGFFFFSHAPLVIGGILFARPPITGPWSECQKNIRKTQLEPQGLSCIRGSPLRRRPRGNIAFTTDALDTHHFLLTTEAHHVEILSCHLCQVVTRIPIILPMLRLSPN